MVFVGDKKYACESCIKGHRSSTCKHYDRPLYEIKKKGRPVTQCEHCRELRKTKQLHVKCMCTSKDDDNTASDVAGPSNLGKGSSKVPASAAFPSGLPPEVLEASVALHSALSDGSDSEYSNASPVPCDCENSAECTGTCAAARASRTKGKARPSPRRGSSKPASSPQSSSDPPVAGPAGIVASAHAAGHRPVLPRPPPAEYHSASRLAHDPSVAPSQSSGSRHHSHGQFYSPYGRIYENIHAAEEYDHRTGMSPTGQNTQPIPVDAPRTHVDPAAALPDFPSWPSFSAASPDASLLPPMSFCGCGPACACPSCLEHRGPDALPNATCANPNTCMACLDYLAGPLPLTTDDSRIAYPDTQAQDVDEWLRQVASAQPQVSTSAQPSLPPFAPTQAPPLQVQSSGDRRLPQQRLLSPSGSTASVQAQRSELHTAMRYDPALLQTYALWGDLHDARANSRPAQGEWDADPD
ncbi:hypothetical protein DAEQUDRAFT_810374, partial [Daedalea quercina L-15889]